MTYDISGKHILITGGTGSFGSAFVSYLLADGRPASLTIFSRDEQKQFEMAGDLGNTPIPVRFVLGDVRDAERLREAFNGMDVVIHSAAMKHVPAAEHNPSECVKTNILGAQNVAAAALACGVARVVALSTDKAALPSNLYGASKLCLEKLLLNADLNDRTRFSVVRYANVFGSKGSVVPFFQRKLAQGSDHLPITDPGMTRFSITMQDGIDLVMFALTEGWGGEIIVPVAPSYRITDVANAIAPDLEHRVVGIRPGEKLHEVMYSEIDAPTTLRRGRWYVIAPQIGRWDAAQYARDTGAEPVADGSVYSSGANDHWLSVDQIRALLSSEL